MASPCATACISLTVVVAALTSVSGRAAGAAPLQLRELHVVRSGRQRRARQRRLLSEFAFELLPESERLAAIARAAPDVAAHLPLHFDEARANPCWRANGTLHCLPAFYLAGGMQCGVAGLWSRLRKHEHVLHEGYDSAPHWWTNHPRSRVGSFDRYVGLFSSRRALAQLEREPRAVLGDVSPASLAFIMAEELRLHYLYLDAFSACHGRCRGATPPAEHAAACRNRTYALEHCYAEAQAAMVPLDFNVPSFLATVMGARPPRVVLMLRDPTWRLWIAFHTYGQYPARYGRGAAGFAGYFGNQSLAFARCETAHGRRRCALRFEAHGPAEADVYYHCDQLAKGMYAAFVPEWRAALPADRLLILRAEEVAAAPGRALRRVGALLGLRRFSDEEMRAAEAVRSTDEAGRVQAEHGPPPAAAATRVRRFYGPWNRALAAMLGDDAFLWRQVD
jgi:hypothetical protein